MSKRIESIVEPYAAAAIQALSGNGASDAAQSQSAPYLNGRRRAVPERIILSTETPSSFSQGVFRTKDLIRENGVQSVIGYLAQAGGRQDGSYVVYPDGSHLRVLVSGAIEAVELRKRRQRVYVRKIVGPWDSLISEKDEGVIRVVFPLRHARYGLVNRVEEGDTLTVLQLNEWGLGVESGRRAVDSNPRVVHDAEQLATLVAREQAYRIRPGHRQPTLSRDVYGRE